MLAVRPAGALNPLRDAALRATPATSDGSRDLDGSPSAWMPHVTLCYSTREQPAEPIIAALGKELPRCHVQIATLSLVVQHGPERDWNWRVVGEAHLRG
jgi:2'-5' RNA ligase superfamily